MFTGDGDFVGVSSYMDYLDFEERSVAFDGFAAFKPLLVDFSGGGETDRVQGMIVTANYFDVLGVRPAHGRFLAFQVAFPHYTFILVLSSHLLDS